jgi:hypothetical protein
MAYTVFFRESNEIFTAGNFIGQQPTEHRELLQTMADALAINGRIVHPLATKTAKGEWSVLLKDDHGDVYTYTLFISRFEQEETNDGMEAERPRKQRELMIIDPSGPRDSVGGYHPGYWSVTHYANLLEEEQRKLFLTTIDQIKNTIPSDGYSVNDDGSITIHIHKQARAYTISVACRAEWR